MILVKKPQGSDKNTDVLSSQSGFTLIEVLITVMILGTLTVLAARSMQQAVQSKSKIQAQIDDVARMRDTLRIMERDINLAYHYRDLEKEINDLIKKYQKPPAAAPGGGAPGTPGGGPAGAPGFNPDEGLNPAIPENPEDALANLNKAPRQDPTTHFVGLNDALHFVTRNTGRITTGDMQADYAEVGYTLKDCRSLQEEGGTSKCIWRRSTPFVDSDVTLGGTEVVLLENVTEFELKYLGKGKQDWVTVWRSDKNGDAVTQKNFPLAVEISLTTEKKDKGKSKKYSMQIVVPIHFPNNPPLRTGGSN
ncbi:MAG: type II secretion system protein GspJ [Bdellovibrionia bacterium]